MTTIRAIDTGFGNTKFSMCGTRNPGGLVCHTFPSLVSEPGKGAAGAEVIGGKRNTVQVQVDGQVYEVGPDVEQLMGHRDARSLHRDYAKTNEYMALTRGALYYMNVPEIDLLVLGLPVNAGESRYKDLKERMTGVHDLDGTRQVNVKNVMVVAQPIGGFADYAWQKGILQAINDEVNLLIDVGFFTLDWVVAKGSQPVGSRCGAYDAGVSEVLSRVNAAIRKDLDCDDISMNRLDQGLRKGEIRLFGKTYPMGPFVEEASSAIEEGLNTLQAKVGATDDIDNIFLCGGGAELYTSAIRARFPRHEVVSVIEPVMANVRGFQLLGELATPKSAATKGVAA
ncbi:PRTRC system protein D [Salinisphaera sp. P385]|uniref:PRTRC system protein D n=1 Tax=Spectribacter acetivorans TaxID=3075603 RepID=A0ABU3BBV5_9GAMM|nr:PRTRC system protein D [Salinisphaera sp. P385]MDT0619945.1 PRTRC system protein D [Salinisphaera sp. P385]